jgi:hypothetical protein
MVFILLVKKGEIQYLFYYNFTYLKALIYTSLYRLSEKFIVSSTNLNISCVVPNYYYNIFITKRI